LTIVSFLVLGAMVAADQRLRLPWSVGLAVLLGGVNGYLNGSAMAGAKLGLAGLAGIVSALFVTVTLAAALAVTQRAPWAHIALRAARR
jgi:hydrogenase/urease accessory protein HupE